jgi:ribosomal protein L7/L12
MSYAADDPRREAERLRIVLQTFAHAQPGMTLDEAVPAIFKAEKRAAELEAVNAPVRTMSISLPDTKPETLAKFIDLQPDIQALVPHKKINAIKELRARTYVGLKEAKEGIEHWQDTRSAAIAYPPAVASIADDEETIAKWIDGRPDIQDLIVISSTRISGIKDVRSFYPTGLREAKNGVDHWLRTRPH